VLYCCQESKSLSHGISCPRFILIILTSTATFYSIRHMRLHYDPEPDRWDMWRHQSPLSSGGEPGAMGHVATSEPSCAGRQGLATWGTWQRRRPPVSGGGVWLRGTRGDARALPCREVRSGAIGNLVTPEPSCAGRRGLAPWDST
jgi:hypothetical protein